PNHRRQPPSQRSAGVEGSSVEGSFFYMLILHLAKDCKCIGQIKQCGTSFPSKRCRPIHEDASWLAKKVSASPLMGALFGAASAATRTPGAATCGTAACQHAIRR